VTAPKHPFVYLTSASGECELHTPDDRGPSCGIAHNVVGRCVEAGDDDKGQPRLIIHTTREQLMNFGSNLVYVDVEVTLHSPNDTIGVGEESK
jgi:hypothetical protein